MDATQEQVECEYGITENSYQDHAKPELYAISIVVVELDVMKTLNELYVSSSESNGLLTDRRTHQRQIYADLLLRAFWPKMSYDLN